MSSSTTKTNEKNAPLLLRVDELEEKVAYFDTRVAGLQELLANLSRKVSELETRLHEDVD